MVAAFDEDLRTHLRQHGTLASRCLTRQQSQVKKTRNPLCLLTQNASEMPSTSAESPVVHRPSSLRSPIESSCVRRHDVNDRGCEDSKQLPTWYRSCVRGIAPVFQPRVSVPHFFQNCLDQRVRESKGETNSITKYHQVFQEGSVDFTLRDASVLISMKITMVAPDLRKPPRAAQT